MSKKIGLAIGKFNPLHNGHAMIFETLLDLGKETSIVPVVAIIGDERVTTDKPMPASLRKVIVENEVGCEVVVGTSAFSLFQEIDSKGWCIDSIVVGSDRSNEYEGVFYRATKKCANWKTIVIERNEKNTVSSSLVRQAHATGKNIELHINQLSIDTRKQIYEGLGATVRRSQL